jgi:hypothetical protein
VDIGQNSRRNLSRAEEQMRARGEHLETNQRMKMAMLLFFFEKSEGEGD